MKNLTIRILIASFAAMILISEVRAQIVTTDKALLVANNWIETIIQKKGSWGEADSAYIDSIREFKRGERVLGYFCKVEPSGYIVLSLRKEFPPVKAYSTRSELEPEMDEGMADLLKDKMEYALNKVQERFGSVGTARSAEVSSLFEIDYRQAWEQLENGAPPIEKTDVGTEAAGDYVEGGDYQEGDILLDTRWHQGHPYNLFCPPPPPPPPDPNCDWDHCTVGCNATAGAQVLRHWCWPPYGANGSPYTDTYEWWNIPNTISETSPAAQINATAELNYEVGLAGNQAYCIVDCATAGHIENMRPGYIGHFRYNSGSSVPYRTSYTATGWFTLIQQQLNRNRPMTYGIPGHAIVCDGWQIIDMPPLYIRQYHMNYGWAGSADLWYTLDSLEDPSVEHLLADHFPVQAITDTVVSGTYPRNVFPYRYFDRDATASFTTTFESGNYLQFLNGIRLRALGHVRIESSATFYTRIFSGGDPSTGIRLDRGTMILTSGGSVKLY